MDCGIVVERGNGKAALHSDEPGRRRNADRGWPCRRARAAGGTAPRSELVRLHELDGLEREAQVDQRQDHRRRDPGDSRRREESLAGRRPGDRAHRLGAARRQADQGGLGAGALRGQCAGNARSRTGDLRHQPGRLAGSRRADRAWSRAPSSGDQHDPAAGGNRPGRREGSASRRGSCTNA